MSSDPRDQDFSWVEAREACSIAKVFLRLRRGVEADVETRNKQFASGRGPFGVVDSGERKFTVYRDTPEGPGQVVEFECRPREIRAAAKGGFDLRATLTVSLFGFCRLVVDGVEHEEWYFRKMALERLLFID